MSLDSGLDSDLDSVLHSDSDSCCFFPSLLLHLGEGMLLVLLLKKVCCLCCSMQSKQEIAQQNSEGKICPLGSSS